VSLCPGVDRNPPQAFAGKREGFFSWSRMKRREENKRRTKETKRACESVRACMNGWISGGPSECHVMGSSFSRVEDDVSVSNEERRWFKALSR
jgi:hypothetical protein